MNRKITTDYNKAVEMFETILEETRTQIVAFFYYFGELKAKDLRHLTGKVNSTIIHHLQILENSGIIKECRRIWREKYYKLSSQFLEVYQNQLEVFNQLRLRETNRALEFYKSIANIFGKRTASLLKNYSNHIRNLEEEFQEHEYKGKKIHDDVFVGVSFRKEVYENKVKPLIDELYLLADEEQKVYGDEDLSLEDILETISVRIISLPTKKTFPRDLKMDEIGPKIEI